MTLIAIGGAEDKNGAMLVHRRILAEAQGIHSRICVITSATEEPDDARQRYAAVYQALNVKNVDILHIDSLAMANSQDVAHILAHADIVFMSGGDQSKLCRALNNTRALEILRQRYNAGSLIIAGTSAGAAAASQLMITGGAPEYAMQKGEVAMSQTGLGFVPDVVIDTHFSERKRLSRLFNAVAHHPGKLGIGLDEDTALIIRCNQPAEVIGSGTVTIVDGLQMTRNNVAQIRRGQAIEIQGLKVYKLIPNSRFDLQKRRKI